MVGPVGIPVAADEFSTIESPLGTVLHMQWPIEFEGVEREVGVVARGSQYDTGTFARCSDVQQARAMQRSGIQLESK